MNWKHWLWLAWLLLLSASANAATPMVAAGGGHSLALNADGKVYSWGQDNFGELGLGRIVEVHSPQAVPGLHLAAGSRRPRVAVGSGHTVISNPDGTVSTWGSNQVGQLGDGTLTNRSSPVRLVGINAVIAVAAGTSFTIALKADGTVWTWGADAYNELSDDNYSGHLSPVQITGLSDVIAIAAGNDHSLAVKSDGSVWAWGSNRYYQLGDGTASNHFSPRQVPGLSGVIGVAAGGFPTMGFSLAIKSDGSVWTWGADDQGTVHSTPFQVQGLNGIVAADASDFSAVALSSDGKVWEWSGGRDLAPKQVEGLTGVVGIAAGFVHKLALKSDGTLWAWGQNSHGELGDGTVNTRTSAQPVPGLDGIETMAAGGYWTGGFSVVLKADGTVWVWGTNSSGQLGVGDGGNAPGVRPSLIAGLDSVVAVAAGDAHSLALKLDGSVWAWGWNYTGQLGDGTTTTRSTPKAVGGLTDVIAVAAGAWGSSQALKSDGSVWAWGNDWSGSVPRQVSGISNAVGLATGSGRNLALKSDGSVWTWTGGSSLLAQPVPGLNSVVALSSGGSGDLALKSDGSVWAWDSRPESHWLQVPGLGGVIRVAAGGGHSLALKSDGSVWTWGYNANGQLGDGTTTDHSSPTKLTVPSEVVSVTASRNNWGGFSFAVKSDGTVLSWGFNAAGTLGDGTYAGRVTPVLITNPNANGPLDLLPEVPNNIPPELIPPFWVNVTKTNSVSTAITYSTEDLNKTGHVYIVAYLRPDSPLLKPSVLPTSRSTNSTQTKDTTTCPTSIAGTVPAVLTRSGWKQTTCTTPTEPLYSGTLNSGNNTFSMYDAAQFDQTKDNGLFCVSYAGSSATSAKGLIRSVVSGVDASLNQCPPIQIGSTGDTSAPSIPLNITATAAGPGQVNLSWSAATDNVGVAHYNIYRGTSLIATVSNVTSYTDTSPQASTAYSYSVMACDIALNCSGQSTNAQTSTPAQPNVILYPGWNLVGNGGSTAMNAASLFGDSSKVYSLWKWVRSGNTPGISYPTWAMYAPGQADGGAAYAASKGYEVLTSIQSAEGFWVNAKAAMSVPMTAPAWILSNTFQPGQSNALPAGWSLIATGEANTASSFNKAIGATPPTPGSIPSNLTTLWAWENNTGRWYFYAPTLEAQGTLQGYVSEKGYLDFGSRTLTPTAGVWVNR